MSRHCDVLKNSAGWHLAYYSKKIRCCGEEERLKKKKSEERKTTSRRALNPSFCGSRSFPKPFSSLVFVLAKHGLRSDVKAVYGV